MIEVILMLNLTDPVQMVRIGGIAQAMMLPVIGIGVLYLRHRRFPKDIDPSRWVTVGLWAAVLLIAWLIGFSAVKAIKNTF